MKESIDFCLESDIMWSIERNKMTTPMMKCGHAANAKDGNGNPCCVICIGIDDGANQIDDTVIIPTDRQAKCADCNRIAKSDPDKLAFFEYRPDRDFDTYYCGCRGWD